MVRFGAFAVAATLSLGALGSWYWPFGSDDEEEPRLADLIEPASTNIDAAADYVADGKIDEAIASYGRALAELDRLEAAYPDRMEAPEFTTVKTKRAYVRTAIDMLRLKQVQDNSKAVAVSDTTELEKKLAEEKAAAASYKADYEMKWDNIVEYWLHLLTFILAFAVLSTITLEFIDKDKR